jgi:hypothetical protein
VTRSSFERDRARLQCAINNVCERRQCEILRASSNPLDRRLHQLTCPAKPAPCGPPSYGDWGGDEPPDSECFDFHSEQARQCLAELEALLLVSKTTPLTNDIFCWHSSPACDEVYSQIEWPECPLEE